MIVFKCIPSYASDGSGKVVKPNPLCPLAGFFTWRRFSLCLGSFLEGSNRTPPCQVYPLLPAPLARRRTLESKKLRCTNTGSLQHLFAKCRSISSSLLSSLPSSFLPPSHSSFLPPSLFPSLPSLYSSIYPSISHLPI